MKLFAAVVITLVTAGAQDKPAAAAEARVNRSPEAKADAAEIRGKTETLHFNVNWPSGLSLGEGEMTSSRTEEGWSFSYHVDAGIPGFALVESARSKATKDLCSLELVKDGTRGRRQINETTTFDVGKLTATRSTGKGGGKSEMRTSACPKDALTFIQFVRRELAAGRLPAAQSVYYGAAYQTRVQYVGTQRIRSGQEMVETDKLTASVKGATSELTIDLFFARDAARTPVLVQIPIAMGKFSVEFVR